MMGSGPALITGLAPAGREASYTGVWMSTFGLSAVTAAAVGAALIHVGGLRLLWVSCALAGLAAAAGCLLLAGPVAARRTVGLAVAESVAESAAGATPAAAIPAAVTGPPEREPARVQRRATSETEEVRDEEVGS
jgi:MFS family permease